MAVMRGNRVGRKWLMKWDELKKFPWYTHRLMHRKRVTCELHDNYFCLMTIKHSISKIEWAIVWALNYYITQSRQKSSASWVADSWSRRWTRCDMESHTRPKGLGALMSWGPEKMLIRCVKKAIIQQSGPWASRWAALENEKDTTLTAIRKRGQNIAVMFNLQLPLTRKPWVTLFEPLQ